MAALALQASIISIIANFTVTVSTHKKLKTVLPSSMLASIVKNRRSTLTQAPAMTTSRCFVSMEVHVKKFSTIGQHTLAAVMAITKDHIVSLSVELFQSVPCNVRTTDCVSWESEPMLPKETSSFKNSLQIIPITNTAIVQLDTMELPVKQKASHADHIVALTEVPVSHPRRQIEQITTAIVPKMTMPTSLMLESFVNTRVPSTVTQKKQKMDNCFAKQRHGSTGNVQLHFQAEFTKFGNLAKDQYREYNED